MFWMSCKCFHMIRRCLDRFLENRKKSLFLALWDVPMRALWGLYFNRLYRETFSEPKMIFLNQNFFFKKNVLDAEIKIFISNSMFLNKFFLCCLDFWKKSFHSIPDFLCMKNAQKIRKEDGRNIKEQQPRMAIFFNIHFWHTQYKKKLFRNIDLLMTILISESKTFFKKKILFFRKIHFCKSNKKMC